MQESFVKSHRVRRLAKEVWCPWNRDAGLLTSVIVMSLLTFSGCGTTRWTDTKRTATEQLLITDAIDKAVQDIDVRPLSGEKVYLEEKRLGDVVDKEYLISSLRQHLLAAGCTIMDNSDDATYIVEARAGAIGTDRHDVLYGVPATTMPSLVNIPGVPSQVPEIPLAKRTDQQAVAKIAVFAYHRKTGRAVWQSGFANHSSHSKDIWFFGAGPFQRGAIYDGTVFAGKKIKSPLEVFSSKREEEDNPVVDLTKTIVFPQPEVQTAAAEVDGTSSESSPEEVKEPTEKEAPAVASLPAGVAASAPQANEPPLTTPPAAQQYSALQQYQEPQQYQGSKYPGQPYTGQPSAGQPYAQPQQTPQYAPPQFPGGASYPVQQTAPQYSAPQYPASSPYTPPPSYIPTGQNTIIGPY